MNTVNIDGIQIHWHDVAGLEAGWRAKEARHVHMHCKGVSEDDMSDRYSASSRRPLLSSTLNRTCYTRPGQIKAIGMHRSMKGCKLLGLNLTLLHYMICDVTVPSFCCNYSIKTWARESERNRRNRRRQRQR